jgi:hypothetical protein
MTPRLNRRKYKIKDVPALQSAICDLVVQHKFDAVDLQIIAERDCSPMPTMRDIALRIGVTHTTVENRLAKIQRLLSAYLP